MQKWYWLNNIDNIISVVSLGRLVRNRMLLGSSTAGCCTAAGTTVEKQITNLLKSIYFVFSTHWQVETGYYHNCETQKTVCGHQKNMYIWNINVLQGKSQLGMEKFSLHHRPN